MTLIRVLQDRSIVIATYALCGFANIASIGTVMGALGSMCPPKASAISSMTVRAMLTGTIVSLMNACVAGKFNIIVVIKIQRKDQTSHNINEKNNNSNYCLVIILNCSFLCFRSSI